MKNTHPHQGKERAAYETLQKTLALLTSKTKAVVGERNFKNGQKIVQSAVYWVADLTKVKSTGSKRARSHDLLSGLPKSRKAWWNLAANLTSNVRTEASEKAREGLEWVGQRLQIPSRKELAMLHEQIREIEHRLADMKPDTKGDKSARTAGARSRRGSHETKNPIDHPGRVS